MELSGKLCRGILFTLLGLAPPLATTQVSSTEQSADQYAERGQAALAAGNLEEAERAFERLGELEPTVAEIHASLGRIYFQQRRFSLAARQLRIAIKLKPSLPKVRTLLAVSLSEMMEYNDALAPLEECFHRSAEPSEKQMCGLELERVYTGLKMDDKAVEIALLMGKLYPDDAEVLYHSSQIYGNMAFQAIHRMSIVASASPWRYLAGGEVNESQGATAAAVDQYRQVLAIDPGHPGVHYRIGRTLLAQGRRSGSEQDQAEALKEFLAELEVDPSNANAAYEVGEINRNAEHLEVAQQYFQMAIDTYPVFEDAHIGLATVLIAEQKPEQAVTELRKAIAIDPSNEVSWYRLAQAERSLGNGAEQNKALAQFKKLHQKSFNQSGPSPEPSELTKQKIDPNTAP